jgi:hypothetical protein
MQLTYNPLLRQGFQISSSVLNFKDSVATYSNLPLSGNSMNDARCTNNNGNLYVWNGSTWINQGTFSNVNWISIQGKPTSTPYAIDTAVSLASTSIQTNILDVDVKLTANSDSKIATQKAVKSYVDTQLGLEQNLWHLVSGNNLEPNVIYNSLNFSNGVISDTLTVGNLIINNNFNIINGLSVANGNFIVDGTGNVILKSLSFDDNKILINSSNSIIQIGKNSAASGVGSVVIGSEALSTSNYSLAIGYAANTSGIGSTSIGNNAAATGEHSVAIGIDATASFASSVAIGFTSTSSGFQSISIGDSSIVLGDYSVAIGVLAQSSGNSSLALGYNSSANFNYSLALGYSAQTEHLNQIVISNGLGVQLDIYNLVADFKSNKISLAGLHFSTLPPVYANNMSALSGGLIAGDVYRTGGTTDTLCIVH